MINLEIRRKTLECLGWEWWHNYGKCYLVPPWGAEEWRAHIGLGFKPGRIDGKEEAIEDAFPQHYKHLAMPALESELGVCWPLFVEWMKENNCRAEIQTEGDGSAGLTIQSRDHDADLEGKTVADSFAPTLEMACCLAIIQASESK